MHHDARRDTSISGRDVNSPVIGSRVTDELQRAGVARLVPADKHLPAAVESKDALYSERDRREGNRDMVVARQIEERGVPSAGRCQ